MRSFYIPTRTTSPSGPQESPKKRIQLVREHAGRSGLPAFAHPLLRSTPRTYYTQPPHPTTRVLRAPTSPAHLPRLHPHITEAARLSAIDWSAAGEDRCIRWWRHWSASGGTGRRRCGTRRRGRARSRLRCPWRRSRRRPPSCGPWRAAARGRGRARWGARVRAGEDGGAVLRRPARAAGVRGARRRRLRVLRARARHRAPARRVRVGRCWSGAC